MSPNGKVLDRNLSLLLKRAYVPALPRPAFRAELLATCLGEVSRARGPRPVPRFLAPLAAAAAVLLLIWAGFALFGPSATKEEPLTAATLLQRGEVALRFDGEPTWRAATAEELTGGVPLEAGVLEAATPAAAAVRVDAEAAAVELQHASRARVGPRASENEMAVRLIRGGVRVAVSATSPRWWLESDEGELRLDVGTVVASLEAGTLRVRVVDGQAWRLDAEGEVLLAAGAELVLRDGRVIEEPGAIVAGGADTERRPVESGEPAAETAEPEVPAPAPVRGAAVRGRVTDAETGEPLESFRVFLLLDREVPEVDEPDVRAFEAEDGAFLWDGLRPDDYHVYVSAKGRAQFHAGRHTLVEGVPLEVDARMVAGGTVRGWVLEAANEAPIPDASVVAETEAPSKVLPLHPPAAGGIEWLVHATDAGPDGAFTLPHLNAGEQIVRVSAPGFAPAWVAVDVASDATRDDLIVRLKPQSGVRGRVTGEDGAPKQGAVILAAVTDDGTAEPKLFSYARGVTDENGRYEIGDLSAGFFMLIHWESMAAMASGVPPVLRPVFLGDAEFATVDFLGDTGGIRLSGTFRDREGKPVPHVKFSLFDEEIDDQNPDWQAGSSDEEGRYEAVVEAPGTYFFLVTYGMGEKLVLTERVEIPEGVTEVEHDVRMWGGEIHGRITRGEDGSPLRNAAVILLAGTGDDTIFAGRVFVDADGGYSFDGLRGGTYVVAAATYTGEDYGLEVSAGLELAESGPEEAPQRLNADLALYPGGRLRIQTVDPSGAPLAGVYVTVVDQDDQPIWFSQQQDTDLDGRALATGLKPGLFRVRGVKDGWEPGEAELRVVAGVATDARITLTPILEDQDR